jgi:hypothetical protein
VGQNTTTVYIFTEPAGGWSGVIHETARLPISGVRAATLSGKTLVALGAGNVIDSHELVVRAPVFVLRRPAAGWQALTAPQPRAFVMMSGQDENFGLEPASLLGGTTAFTNIRGCADEGYPPCLSTIWAINGLSSSVAAPKQLPVNASSDEIADADGSALASDGTALALGADGSACTRSRTPCPRGSPAPR